MSSPEAEAAEAVEEVIEILETPADDPPPPPPEETSPWQQAKSISESMQMNAVMEDMERGYHDLQKERDSLLEKIQTLTAEKEAAAAAQSNLTALQQEKESLQNNFQQNDIKSKGLEEEKTLLQERMDRMQKEADQLREDLRYA
jgi:predicted nuclease with TOPRIM domain